MLAELISTLMHSWGGDTPGESFWVLSELITFINKEFGTNIEGLKHEYWEGNDCDRYDKIIDYLESDDCN